MKRTMEKAMFGSMLITIILVFIITFCTCELVEYFMNGDPEEVYVPENVQNYVENFSDLQDVLLEAKDKDEVEIVLSPLIKTENIDFNEGGRLYLTGDNSPKRITINGNGRVVNVVGSTGGTLLTVWNDTELTLRNITLQGLYPDLDPNNDEANNNKSLVYIYDAKLVLEDGVVIENNHFVESIGVRGGGGVYVGLYGVLEMRGTSIIRNNKTSGEDISIGGGVRLEGKLKMNGGKIMNNEAAIASYMYGGGGVWVARGTVTDGQGNKFYAELINNDNSGDISGNKPNDVDHD
jgi:hypothetical protein